jgi:hypothetical protein
MMRGLTLHYLHQRTVEDAIEQGRAGGVPEALLQCLPAMMFEITSAAGAVFGGGQDLDKVVNEVTRRARASGRAEGFGRSDAMALVKSAIQFLTELSEQRGIDQPLPEMTEPWYRYGTD